MQADSTFKIERGCHFRQPRFENELESVSTNAEKDENPDDARAAVVATASIATE